MSESLYRRWKEAVPSLNFPFQFQAKGETITNTWHDVREGYYRDAINETIHRATAHIAPTSLQSERIRDEIKRENRSLSPRSPSVMTSGESELSLPRVLVPRISQVDPMICTCGRKEYLKSRRRRAIEQERHALWATTSQMYGFGANVSAPAFRIDSKNHRKVGGMKDAFRPRGVFPRL